MARKRVNAARVVSGAVVMGIGGLIASPLDEAATTAVSGGLAAPIAAVQLPVTGIIGTSMVLAGYNMIVDGLKGK